ncbi:MAG: c-type cytochrome [Deltaproteobacteria bacterium]|nr:MAG: c-type cytochrome [Deltaproteobacteria bacterium]
MRWFLPVLLVACGEPVHEPAPLAEAVHAEEAAVVAEPAHAMVEADGDKLGWAIPDIDHLPDDPAVQRGYALATDTHLLLPDNVGDNLNCTNCHIAGGTRPKAAPWVGVNTRYPKYRKRSGKVDDLPERINGCFERSMNGTKLDPSSDDMQSLVAYMNWLSEDVEDGTVLAEIGMPRITPPAEPDPEHGEALFMEKCTACHQADGQGIMAPDGKTLFPPLWGEHSYNVGAGMARLHTAAAFIRWNMPQGQEGTLTDQEAYDIASFFIFQGRPDFAKKAGDWPKGDKPEDARY